MCKISRINIFYLLVIISRFIYGQIPIEKVYYFHRIRIEDTLINKKIMDTYVEGKREDSLICYFSSRGKYILLSWKKENGKWIFYDIGDYVFKNDTLIEFNSRNKLNGIDLLFHRNDNHIRIGEQRKWRIRKSIEIVLKRADCLPLLLNSYSIFIQYKYLKHKTQDSLGWIIINNDISDNGSIKKGRGDYLFYISKKIKIKDKSILKIVYAIDNGDEVNSIHLGEYLVNNTKNNYFEIIYLSNLYLKYGTINRNGILKLICNDESIYTSIEYEKSGFKGNKKKIINEWTKIINNL